MGASHVVVTEEENLAERVASITMGKGVRFAFDPIGGPIIGEIAELMCPYGTIVLYGILDFTPVNLPVMPLIGKNLSILGYAMLLDDQPERNERAIAFIREGTSRNGTNVRLPSSAKGSAKARSNRWSARISSLRTSKKLHNISIICSKQAK